MKWKRFLVSSQFDSVYEAVDWLDSLINSNFGDREDRVITDIFSWQIVDVGHGFKAVAMVLVEKRS